MAVDSRGRCRMKLSDFGFFILLMVSWSGFFAAGGCPGRLGLTLHISFCFLAAVIAQLALKLMGYFDPLNLFPRKSDVVLIGSAVVIGGGIMTFVYNLVLPDFYCSPFAVLVLCPLMAAAVSGGQHLFIYLKLKSGFKKKIVLALSSEERASLMEEFNGKGVGAWIEYLSVGELRKIIFCGREREVSLIVVSQRGAGQFDSDASLIRAHLIGVPVVDYRQVISNLSGRISISDIDLWSFVTGATPQTALLRASYLLKEFTEPLVALAMMICLSPVIAGVAIAVKLTSPGPVFYGQRRTGYLGRSFMLYKFRSMRVDSEVEGPRWASENDERFTPVGGFLRRTRLDELPQLWNIIRGEMGFIGPRPERPEIYSALRSEIPLFPLRQIVRPGITGWAQVCAGYAATVAESRKKLEYDLFYIQHMSPRLDFIIAVKTFQIAVFGEAAVVRRETVLPPAAEA